MQQLFVKDSGAWRGTRRVKKEEEGQNNFGFYPNLLFQVT
jgi:hypothetical protein